MGIEKTSSNMPDFVELETMTLARIAKARSQDELNDVRVNILGARGILSKALRTIGSMPVEKKKLAGKLANSLKERLIEEFIKASRVLADKQLKQRLLSETQDITLPVCLGPSSDGRIHPLSKVTMDVTEIFTRMGCSIIEGPEIETDYYNFTALNFPYEHPARREHDTFFLNTNKAVHSNYDNLEMTPNLLRTHTTPAQIRAMATSTPPIRTITIGRVYRCDSDQTHTPMFHQLDGLIIDQTVNLSHLKWLLIEFCRNFFESTKIEMRFRPSFFPFTEPSMEVDICCRHVVNNVEFGSGDNWLEVLGCGILHPNVMRYGGIDPDKYQGLAWGIGLDRLTMLKYGIPDLREFFNSDTRWIDYYGHKSFS